MVKVTSPSFSNNKVLREELKAFFPEAVFSNRNNRYTKEELIGFIKYSDGIIVGLDQIDSDVIDECQNLKIIAKYGVGLDNIDIDYCKKKGIKIGWTPGVNKLSVAEQTLGFMLTLCRNLFFTSNNLKKGEWRKSGGSQLSEKTIGIIGVGNIGKEVIRLLKPFHCNVLVNDIIVQKKYYKAEKVKETSKEEIYQQSDIISIHTPLTSSTKNLIDKGTIKQMKETTFVINTARGSIVNEKDLQEALINKRIAGAAIDVYEIEPAKDKAFLSLPNLICTPHIGGNSEEAVLAMGRSAINHLKKHFIV